MNIKDNLFYKIDKKTGENRVSKLKVGLIAIVLSLIILFILASFSNTSNTETGTYNYENTYGSSNQLIPPISEAEYKQSCDEISFKKLNKNPDSRIGENYTFSGKAFDVKEESGKTKLQLLVNGPYSIDRIWVTYDGSLDIYDGDYVTIWGQVIGSYNYTSVDNSHYTLPWVHVWYVK